MIYKDTYLTFEAITSGTFSFTSTPYSVDTLQYSVDNGSTWTSGTTTSTVTAGNKVMFKTNLSSSYIPNYNGIGSFSSTGRFKAYGNPMSLLFGDNFVGQTSLSYDYIFYNLFANCIYLEDASLISLPATTLTKSCYRRMFYGCTSLVAGPWILPATELAQYCYERMFYGCTSLTSMPILPATTLASYCYREMFYGCTSLTTIPKNYLPATTLASYCYYCMFIGCSSLVNVPSDLLPAVTLDEWCYGGMFRICTSLTTAPDLNAPVMSSKCYYQMFLGCTSLNYVKCLVLDPGEGDDTYTYSWLANVSSSGTFITSLNSPGSTWKSKRTDGDCGIPDGWSYSVDTYSSSFLTFEAISSGTFSFSTNNIQYSLNNGTSWTTLTAGSSTPTIAAGNKIMFKASLTPTTSGIGTFSSTGNFNVSGNVNSLIFDTAFYTSTSLDLSAKTYAFRSLFKNCTGLISAENLVFPSTTLSANCYENMFYGCSSLTTAPKILPATTLANSCYRYMFQDCGSLTKVPELPATTLADWCYGNMFTSCTSLSNLPTLPAQTLAVGCYYGMFSYCYAITKVPSNYLPSQTLAEQCYWGMFKECTALKKSPVLRAPILVYCCYHSMFESCTSLECVTCLATDITSDCITDWLWNVTGYWYVDGTYIFGKFIQNSSYWNSDNIPTYWRLTSYDDDLVYDMTLSIGTDSIDYNNSTTIANGVETLYYGYIDDVTDSTTFSTSPTGIITIT